MAAVSVNQDKTTILFVIAGYFSLLIAVGLAFRILNKDTPDHSKAGRNATRWLRGGSVFMRVFSTWAYTGGAAMLWGGRRAGATK